MRGRAGKVAALNRDADRLVAAILAGTTGVMAVMHKYAVGYPRVKAMYDARTSPEQRQAVRRRKLLKWGRRGRFKAGHTPWNKGLKGWYPPGCRATQFKPGCIRGQAARRYKALGMVVVRNRNRKPRSGAGRPRRTRRRFIKIREDGRSQYRFIPLARFLWQRAHGPVPAGKLIVHADGDTMNDDLANLICVDRREHLARQYARDPQLEQRRRRRAGRLAAQRWQRYRQLKAARRPTSVLWDCPGCGWGVAGEAAPARCPKCGSYTFVRIETRAGG